MIYLEEHVLDFSAILSAFLVDDGIDDVPSGNPLICLSLSAADYPEENVWKRVLRLKCSFRCSEHTELQIHFLSQRVFRVSIEMIFLP